MTGNSVDGYKLVGARALCSARHGRGGKEGFGGELDCVFVMSIGGKGGWVCDGVRWENDIEE